MSKTAVKPISRKSNLVTQEHEKEILIYDLLIDKAFSLNETSSLIWNLCNGTNSVAEITTKLSKKFNHSINEDFVWLALERFKNDNLLANGEEISIDFGGLSRRDVIRRIGFASLVTLPVISALIAPTAIHASSTCSTAAPGGVQCRCIATDVPSVGDNCGTNYASGDGCNAGCTCQRTAASCPAGPYTGSGTAGTCQGSCV